MSPALWVTTGALGSPGRSWRSQQETVRVTLSPALPSPRPPVPSASGAESWPTGSQGMWPSLSASYPGKPETGLFHPGGEGAATYLDLPALPQPPPMGLTICKPDPASFCPRWLEIPNPSRAILCKTIQPGYDSLTLAQILFCDDLEKHSTQQGQCRHGKKHGKSPCPPP